MLDSSTLSGKQKRFLQRLRSLRHIPSLQRFCRDENLDFNFLKGFILSGLATDYLRVQELGQEQWHLTSKGEAAQGQLPGTRLAQLLGDGERDLERLQTRLGSTFSGDYGALRREQWVDLQEGARGEKTLVILDPEGLAQMGERQGLFWAIVQGNPLPHGSASALTWLTQQGWIALTTVQDYEIEALPTLDTLDLKPIVTTLTSELLLSGQWRQVELKAYAIHDQVPTIPYGRPSLLSQCIQEVRDIFLNMGFEEMGGSMIESAFWNFDALFTPQDHPAREVQDTFYLAQPTNLPLPDDRHLMEQVKAIHESSYGGTWTETEASRAILRAQTTTSTARKLYELQGQTGKYFSIDKVFRNETPDRTHLPEFHQIEGVVVGELLSVRSLMGYLTYFYQRLGFEDLRFKPTYNPYTEPSLEVYAYHGPSDKYLEVGNSGLFRPEMLGPLGYEGKSTIAWGLGLERIVLLLHGVEKLSDLVGPDSQLHPNV